MKNNRIAIVGSEGHIGRSLVKSLKLKKYDVIGINRNIENPYFLNLEDPRSFNFELFDTCSYLVFCAAISSPDLCETNYESSHNVNVIGTKIVIREALSRNCRVIFYSSDAVFGEDNGTPFYEHSERKPVSKYGYMKKEIEDFFSGEIAFKTLRLSYVISLRDQFLKYILNCQINGVKAQIYHPFYRNCVTLSEVIDVTSWVMENWADFEPNMLNVCGSELVSRVRIIDEMNRITKNKTEYDIVYPGKKFFETRPEIIETQSFFIRDILKKYDLTLLERIIKNQIGEEK